jgi:carboxypeptidase PM20D1
MVRKILAALAVVLICVAGVVGYRTATFTASAPPAAVAIPDLSSYAIDAPAAARRLSAAIRFRTVSLAESQGEPGQFTQFHAWMAATYPAFHAAAKREVIGELSLLYTWEGSDKAQPPLLLLAHQDTVPAPEDTLAQWQVDPFAGTIRDDAVWGRGAIDDKGSLVALLEAAELLAAQGRKPERTILFAFGHDEEIGGSDGAQQIAAELARRGVRAWFALDEGLLALETHPITGGPVSMIGIAEKGGGTMRVRAAGAPGHSSMPPPETAVSLLAAAIGRVHAMPIQRGLEGGPALDMMRALAPHMSVQQRVAVANEWLFAPLLRQSLNTPVSRALMGTSMAPTMVAGGVRPNVLPGEATAMINFRIHPRDGSADLLRRARDAVAPLDGVSIEWAEEPREASPVSSNTSSSYALIAALSGEVLPRVPVAPGLVIAGTDSRLYGDVAENVYRFQPIMLSEEGRQGLHGLNEHLSIANLERMIRFYVGLMEAGAM